MKTLVVQQTQCVAKIMAGLMRGVSAGRSKGERSAEKARRKPELWEANGNEEIGGEHGGIKPE